MKYNFFLRLKTNEDEWINMGVNHIISWNVRDLIEASSGWYIYNEDKLGLASDLVPTLQKGIIELNQSSQVYADYEILHGFGTIKSVLKFYKELLYDCQQYPYTEIYGYFR